MATSTIKADIGFRNLETNTDLNDVKSTGLFFCNGVKNSPTGSSLAWGFIISIADSNLANVKQIWMPNSAEQLFTRSRNNESWTSWKGITLT